MQDNTLAASMRLRAGDIILRIHGVNIASADDVQRALGAIKKGAKMAVEFVRRGERRLAETKQLRDAGEGRAAPDLGKRQRVRESIR